MQRYAIQAPGGRECAAVTVWPNTPDIWAVVVHRVEPIDADASLALLRTALEHARARGARGLEYRHVIRPEAVAIARALPALGFQRVGERVEFDARLNQLPDDAGTPLRWRQLPDFDALIALYARVEPVDHHAPPFGDRAARVRALLSDPELTGGLQCAEIGTLDGRQAALVIAQARTVDGWGRITHMGLVEEFRGRGLGRWVHRHGFAMMRRQGVVRYEGGTDATNAAMIRLFQRHGCRETCRMVEWLCRFDDPSVPTSHG